MSEEFRASEAFKRDIETCFATSCNFCEHVCPVYELLRVKTVTARGRNRIILGDIMKRYEPDEALASTVYQCLLCGACERWCTLPTTKNFRFYRAYLVRSALGLEKHRKIVENIRNYANPYGTANKQAWQSRFRFSSSSDILFFAGCTLTLKLQSTLCSVLPLLQPEKMLVMRDEPCCGGVAFRTGYLHECENATKKILIFVEEHKINEIVTFCPGCHATLRELFRTENLKITHAVEKFVERLDNGKLVLKKKFGHITYHDPCHLGRFARVFEPPRRIIESIGRLVEMKNIKFDSRCCGAGGGFRAAYPELSYQISLRRIEEAQETGAEILATACPFCEVQFFAAGKMDVRDVLELAAECI